MPYYSVDPHIRWDIGAGTAERDELFEFVGIVKGVAAQLGIRVRWGGNFKTFFDGPHWELV